LRDREKERSNLAHMKIDSQRLISRFFPQIIERESRESV
jgi:hypothetical protein